MTSPEFAEQLLNAVGEAIVVTDLEARITYSNAAAARIFGWTREDVVGRPIAEVAPPADRRPDPEEVLKLIRRGETWRGEYPVRTGSGSVVAVRVRNKPLRDAEGRVVGVVGIFKDVTSEREEHRARRETERVNEAMLAAMPDLTFRLSAEGRYVDVWAQDATALVAPREVLIGRSVTDMVPADVADQYLANIRRALESSVLQCFEYQLPLPTGDRAFEARLAPSAEGEVIVVVRDITERTRAEREIRESRDRLELAMEAADMGMWDLDVPSGTITCSFGMFELMRIDPGAFDDRFDTFLGYIHPEDRDVFAITDPDDLTFTRDFRVRCGDGVERWLQTRGQTYLDEYGRPVRMVGVSIDITDRKEYEHALVVAKETAEAMARLKDNFLANISHEIRTPLASIIGFADLLIEETAAELNEMAQLVRGAGERLLITLESVLDFAKLESGSVRLKPTRIDIVDHVQEMLTLFATEADVRGLHLEARAEREKIYASVDAGAFTRVLNNLLSNAFKFTEHGGITIEIREGNDATVEIAVADTGIGMAKDFQSRLFEEFSQESEGLARSHQGVGLGLAITQRLVRLMGGSISVESRKGEGTVFTLTLPM